MNANSNNPWRATIVAFVLGAMFMSWSNSQPNQASADTRKATPTSPDQHFKSGGRLAEGVLQEILVVLKRIDDRLARLEENNRPGRRSATPKSISGETDSGEGSGISLPEIKIQRGS